VERVEQLVAIVVGPGSDLTPDRELLLEQIERLPPVVALDDGLSSSLIQLARQHAGERVRLLLNMVHHCFSSAACMGKTREPRTGLASLCHRYSVIIHIRQLKPTVRSLSQKDRRIALLLASRVLLSAGLYAIKFLDSCQSNCGMWVISSYAGYPL